MSETSKAYSRGYYRGLQGRWPEHRPPAPPNKIVREVLDAARGLRDTADGICATLSEDDEFAELLAPKIDALDDAMVEVTRWLANPETV